MSPAAVILAGGRGSRLGGVRKAELLVGDEPLLARVLASVSGCGQRIVVGFPDLGVPSGVNLVQEDPPGSGPAAGIAAGVAHIAEGPQWVLVLACDLPGVADVVPGLLAGANRAAPATSSIFARAELPDGPRTEWLTGIHRLGPLRRVITALGEGGVIDCSVRRLFAPLSQETIPAPPGSTHDIDTWEDHQQWQEKAGRT